MHESQSFRRARTALLVTRFDRDGMRATCERLRRVNRGKSCPATEWACRASLCRPRCRQRGQACRVGLRARCPATWTVGCFVARRRACSEARARHHRRTRPEPDYRSTGPRQTSRREQYQGPLGGVYPNCGRKALRKCSPRLGHCRVGSSRRRLWYIRPLRKDRRLALVLVGRCPHSEKGDSVHHGRRMHRSAKSEIPRLFHQ